MKHAIYGFIAGCALTAAVSAGAQSFNEMGAYMAGQEDAKRQAEVEKHQGESLLSYNPCD